MVLSSQSYVPQLNKFYRIYDVLVKHVKSRHLFTKLTSSGCELVLNDVIVVTRDRTETEEVSCVVAARTEQASHRLHRFLRVHGWRWRSNLGNQTIRCEVTALNETFARK